MTNLTTKAIQVRKQQKILSLFSIAVVVAFVVIALATGVIIGRACQTTGRLAFFKEQVINLFVGILGGISTTFFLWYSNKKLEQLWKNLVANISSDIKVNGIWVEKYLPVIHKEEMQKQELILDLRQEGYSIHGTIKADDTPTCPEAERKGLRVFDVLGRSKDEMIGLDCILRSDNKKGRVQYLLRFAGDGSRMVGWTTYFDIQNEVITAAECEFYRIEDAKDVSDALKELNENRDASIGSISNGSAD